MFAIINIILTYSFFIQFKLIVVVVVVGGVGRGCGKGVCGKRCREEVWGEWG